MMLFNSRIVLERKENTALATRLTELGIFLVNRPEFREMILAEIKTIKQILKERDMSKIPQHDRIRRRMEEITTILKNGVADDDTRIALQSEYRQLEKDIKSMPEVQIFWLEESETLLWIDEGVPVKGLSGPMARAKYEQIKNIVQPYTKEELQEETN